MYVYIMYVYPLPNLVSGLNPLTTPWRNHTRPNAINPEPKPIKTPSTPLQKGKPRIDPLKNISAANPEGFPTGSDCAPARSSKRERTLTKQQEQLQVQVQVREQEQEQAQWLPLPFLFPFHSHGDYSSYH